MDSVEGRIAGLSEASFLSAGRNHFVAKTGSSVSRASNIRSSAGGSGRRFPAAMDGFAAEKAIWICRSRQARASSSSIELP